MLVGGIAEYDTPHEDGDEVGVPFNQFNKFLWDSFQMTYLLAATHLS